METVKAVLASIVGIIVVIQYFLLGNAKKRASQLQGQVFDEQLKTIDQKIKDAEAKIKKDESSDE